MQIELMKAEFARDILNEQDVNLLKKVISFFIKEKEASISTPCQYTIDEIRVRLAKSEEDIKAGHTYSTEEVFKPYEQWL